MLRASSLPALSECPCFEPGTSEFQQDGTDRHKALELHFAGDDSLLEMLPDEDQDGIRWAADYIRLNAPMREYPLRWEKENSGVAIVNGFSEVPGTADLTCGPVDIFDLKWRSANYEAQMANYALIRYQETSLSPEIPINVHLLFACFKRAEVLRFDYQTAEAIVSRIAAAYEDPGKQPNPCGYCGWCANRVTCAALNQRAQAVAAGREDWKLQQYHASAITTPEEMSKALALASLLEKWAKAVKWHAKEMVIKQGIAIPGYVLKSENGKSSCADVLGAFNASGLAAEEFLQCCEFRLETSKTNPDKRGLADVLKAKKGIPKAAAKRELKRALAPYMRTPKEILKLKAVNEPEDETSTEEE